jgi:hypothetical protein
VPRATPGGCPGSAAPVQSRKPPFQRGGRASCLLIRPGSPPPPQNLLLQLEVHPHHFDTGQTRSAAASQEELRSKYVSASGKRVKREIPGTARRTQRQPSAESGARSSAACSDTTCSGGLRPGKKPHASALYYHPAESRRGDAAPWDMTPVLSC